MRQSLRHCAAAGVLIFALIYLSSTVQSADPIGRETALDVLDGQVGPVLGPPAPRSTFPDDYGTVGSVSGRTVLWVVIEQHFLLGSLLLGGPMISFILQIFSLIIRKSPEKTRRYDRLAYEVLQFILPFFTLTVLSGGLLLAAFLYLYPAFFAYMARLFQPVVFLYALAFVFESLLIYAYYIQWQRARESPLGRWVHLSLGALLNANGVLIIFWANSWMGFMMSPSGVDADGRFLGNIWKAVHNPIWHPLNVHRVLASIMFGGVVIGSFSAYRFLKSRNDSERAFYDWVGSVMATIVMVTISLLPFAGYWFAKVIFAYRQRMGVTLMGGELSWLFVVQAMLIGGIFIVIAYYLWQGMARMPGSERYYPAVKYLLITLIVCLMIWSTPHTLPATPQEFKAMGSTQHPVVGNYGVMAAKNTAINTIILTIALCLVLYRRCNKKILVSWARTGNLVLIILFVAAEINILFLGIYGFYVPARIRVGLSLPQFITALFTLGATYGLNAWMLRSAQTIGPIRWGRLPKPGAYALFALSLFITLTMILMGYIRSSVRLDWHVNEIMQDTTPWASSLPMGEVFTLIFLNLILFWGIVILMLSFLHRRSWRLFSVASEGMAAPPLLGADRPIDWVPQETHQGKI